MNKVFFYSKHADMYFLHETDFSCNSTIDCYLFPFIFSIHNIPSIFTKLNVNYSFIYFSYPLYPVKSHEEWAVEG